MKEKIKKYIPDVLILIGVYLLATEFSSKEPCTLFCGPKWEVVWGIMLITIGIIVGIRRYLQGQKSEK